MILCSITYMVSIYLTLSRREQDDLTNTTCMISKNDINNWNSLITPYITTHAFGFSSLNIMMVSVFMQLSFSGANWCIITSLSDSSFGSSSMLDTISTFFPVFFFNFSNTFMGSIRPVTTTWCSFMLVMNFSTPNKSVVVTQLLSSSRVKN